MINSINDVSNLLLLGLGDTEKGGCKVALSVEFRFGPGIYWEGERMRATSANNG